MVKIQGGNIFGGCLNLKYFYGMPAIPDIWGQTVDARSMPMYQEKLRVSPWG